jgi:hypothetical protein
MQQSSINNHLNVRHTMDEILSNGIEYEMVEDKNKVERCSTCDFTCKQSELLEKHKMNFKEFPQQDASQQYVCTICHQKFPMILRKIVSHTRWNHTEEEILKARINFKQYVAYPRFIDRFT